MITSSLLLAIILLIAPFGKLKTITLSVVSVALAVAPNVVVREPCSCHALLASVLLNVITNVLLDSFLAPAIRLLPPS